MWFDVYLLQKLPTGTAIKFVLNDELFFVRQPNGLWRRSGDGQEYPSESFTGYDIEVTSELEMLSKALEQK